MTAGLSPMRRRRRSTSPPREPSSVVGEGKSVLTRMIPGRDLCGADREICQAYQTVTTDQHASAAECRAACNAASAKLGMTYLLDNCDYTRVRGNTLCEQQCLRLYPAPGASPAPAGETDRPAGEKAP